MRRGFFFGHSNVAARTGQGSRTVHRKEPRNSHVAKITTSFQYGKHTVTLETGEIARQTRDLPEGALVNVKVVD